MPTRKARNHTEMNSFSLRLWKLVNFKESSTFSHSKSWRTMCFLFMLIWKIQTKKPSQRICIWLNQLVGFSTPNWNFKSIYHKMEKIQWKNLEHTNKIRSSSSLNSACVCSSKKGVERHSANNWLFVIFSIWWKKTNVFIFLTLTKTRFAMVNSSLHCTILAVHG